MARTKKDRSDDRPVIMKTHEFKLYLNRRQEAVLNDWLDKGRHIWNAGLRVLYELQQQDWRKKAGFDPLEGNELWEWYVNEIDGKKVFALSCNYAHKKNDHRPACRLRRPKELNGAKLTLMYRASGTQGMCTRFKNGILEDLRKAWDAYKDPNRPNMKNPRFKGEDYPLKSLSNTEAKTTVTVISSNRIKFPKLGIIRTKGLDERIKGDFVFSQARICKKASGWYLQLTGKEAETDFKIKHPDNAIGVDPGVALATVTDYGRKVENPRYLERSQRRLRRIQRQLSRQKKGGANAAKTKKRLAKTHEKIARQRSAFWHKESTILTDRFGGIAIEDNSLNNMKRRPKPKKKESGEGYDRNGAAAKSGLNKSLADVGYGAFKIMVVAKAKAKKNEVHLVASHHNSQTCSQCGHKSPENRRSQARFVCQSCGFTLNADINAAINVRRRAEWKKEYLPVTLTHREP